MSQREVALVGRNNTKAAITGQEELLIKTSMVGTSTMVINSTTAVTGEFESIVVLEDTVFVSISLLGANVLSSLVTNPSLPVKAGAIISWGKGQFFNSIQLVNGSVLAVKR